MDDEKIINRIDELAREEHQLFELESDRRASANDQERLQQIQTMLDQCWDLLRQRRAKREFGGDPDEAKIRDSKTVENYSG